VVLRRNIRKASILALLCSALGLLIVCGAATLARGEDALADPHSLHGVKICGGKTPAALAYGEIMDRMHGPMMAAMAETDPDVAFVKGMIPHHQGAVEMAEWVLKYGKDPKNRKLANEIILQQKLEISQMRAWLTAHEGHHH
jgi:hypothetical protein